MIKLSAESINEGDSFEGNAMLGGTGGTPNE